VFRSGHPAWPFADGRSRLLLDLVVLISATAEIDSNSAVSDNTAPSGRDIENVAGLGLLTISDSAVATPVDGSPVWKTSIAATDTATSLTAAPDPSGSGGVVFSVRVLAAQAGVPTPTGTVTLLDGANNPLGTATLDANGRANFPAMPATLGGLVAQPAIHAVYGGDGTGTFTGSTSAPLIQAVNPLTVTFDASDTTSAQAAADVIGAMTAPVDGNGAPIPVTAVLRLAQGTYQDLTLSTQDNVTLVVFGGGKVATVNGTTVVGNSPALVVTRGNVALSNLTLTTATDAPTVLVSGGHLTLRNDVVQSSTGYSDPAIAVSGGSTLDLGTAASPGGNTINVNGAGQLVLNTGPNLVTAVGNTFQINGAAVFPVTTTALASSVNPSLLNQPVTFTATVTASTSGTGTPTGTVTFVDRTTGVILGVVSLSSGKAQWTTSALPVNAQSIGAVYSGDANYITSAATVLQRVDYHFSGFLAPLNTVAALAAGRTVPIKFQLTDANGHYITSLAAVQSLIIRNGAGTDVTAGAGSTQLRYDPSANQYVFNWQTKGLGVGSYQIMLSLNDGTTYTRTVQLGKTGSSGLTTSAAGGTGSTTGALLGGDVDLYVDNGNGDPTSDELARIDDAVASVDATIAPYGVTITEVSDPTQANVTLDMGTTSAVGGYAAGVLGCTTDAGAITLIQGWDWYAGSDPTQVGSGRYDFETVVVHELGHALGLGHSADPASVMYATLAAGTADRALTSADLNVPDSDSGPCALHAAPGVQPPPPAGAVAGEVQASAGGSNPLHGATPPAGLGQAPVPVGDPTVPAMPAGLASRLDASSSSVAVIPVESVLERPVGAVALSGTPVGLIDASRLTAQAAYPGLPTSPATDVGAVTFLTRNAQPLAVAGGSSGSLPGPAEDAEVSPARPADLSPPNFRGPEDDTPFDGWTDPAELPAGWTAVWSGRKGQLSEAALDALFRAGPSWDSGLLRGRAGSSAGMEDSIRSVALALAVGDGADEGEGSSPAPWNRAAGGLVACALLGVYWGARAEGPEPRRQRPERQG
jgi:hypothetical protein